MSLALDHLVIAVADLDKALADYTELGFTVIRGGEHANGITHNVLVVLQDGAYLELIAWKRPDPGNRWSDIFHGVGEGFVDYALLPDDIAAVVARAQARGLDIASPEPGGRNRPDGERLDWQTARSPRPDVPFLCGDVTPRRLRVQEGEIRRHPNGVTGVAKLTVAVKDLEQSLKRNAALLGTGEVPIRQESVGGTPAQTASFTLANGTIVTLASPTASEGALAATLASRGEGPFAAVFAAGGGAPRELDPALTHGARLTIA
ncbi:VOC family protein [Enterovirga aerilata]|uniref:VOC family protein n=1 Tax=Enterovirga aerilata TaxID=2730920 RepID=A0A849I604_9HYPH|nr:VOC family protein [Enterovirga sp. DB1703]NNM71530.1 VOC family protein [Enterovirga sp. DB1703]